MNPHLPLTIRPANINDFKVLADIWFEASVKAHHFIDENYWEQNKVKMQEVYLPMSEVYLIEDKENIHGFIALIENNIAAIFVSPTQQARGIGKALINHAKDIRIQLELNVYQENENSVRFYQSNDFKIIKETIDINTNAKEFVMLWEK